MNDDSRKMIAVFAHYMGEKNKGGLGVLALHASGDSFIWVTTSLCSSKDQYSKKVAVDTLRDLALAGMMMRLPIHTSGMKNMNHATLRSIADNFFLGWGQR